MLVQSIRNLCIACRPFACSVSLIIHVCIIHVTIVLVDLCNNIGLVGVSAKWSYVTASPSHHDQAIPILSPLLFMHVGHPYIKIRRIFDLLVNLVIAATLPVIEKHGIDKVWEPFVHDLQILATEGVTLTHHGEEQVFRGGLLLSLADNLGSNALGGFKQSFSFALRFCQSCYVTNDTCKSVSDSSELQYRSDEKHRRECALLCGPLHDHYSKIYGINRQSILLDIPHFSMPSP